MAVSIILGVVLAAVLGWWFFLRARPLCKLTLREGDTVGLEFVITDREATIGSEEEQTVTISHPGVSRRHAVLRLDDGKFILSDESSQGTKVNGAPIRETVLRSGDLINLGDSVDLIFTRLG